MLCLIPTCDRKSRVSKMCDKHYRRFRKCNDIKKTENDSIWSRIGKKYSEKTCKKISEAAKGRKGPIHTIETIRKLSESRKGENNPMWKGDNVNYKSLHVWVRRNIPKQEKCSICNLVKRLDACNISGKYLRDLSDWEYLCHKCHFVKYSHQPNRDSKTGRYFTTKKGSVW